MPHINMRAAGGEIVTGWLASQTDMLASDWTILPDCRQPKTFTAEQRAGMEKARKVKRMMEHTNNEGIRANARSSLDTLLEKHGITEADL